MTLSLTRTLAVALGLLLTAACGAPAAAPPPAATQSAPGSPAAAKSPAASPQTSGALTPVTVVLDWYPWANHSGLLLARDRGYFADEGLDVKIEQPANPEDVLKIVARGQNTIGLNYETDVLLARGQDIPVQSIAAIVQHPLNSVMTLKESGITRPAELKGKTVGFPGIPSNEAYLKAMLEKDGLTLSDVKLVNVGFDLVPALIGKRVDAIIGAYWAHESILAELQGHPVNIMRVEEWGVPDYYEIVLVASDDLAKNQPDLARRFLRAVSKGYDDAATDRTAGIEAVLQENPQAKRDLETKSLDLLVPLWEAPNGPFGSQQADRWTGYADWLKAAGLLPESTDPTTAYAPDLVSGGS